MLWAIRDKLSQFDALSADAQEAPNKNSRVINENKIRMAKLEQEIEGLIDKVALAGETVMERINRRVEALEKERRALALENVSLEREGSASAHRVVTDHAENWPALSFADKRKVVDLLIDRVVLKDGTVKVVWKL